MQRQCRSAAPLPPSCASARQRVGANGCWFAACFVAASRGRGCSLLTVPLRGVVGDRDRWRPGCCVGRRRRRRSPFLRRLCRPVPRPLVDKANADLPAEVPKSAPRTAEFFLLADSQPLHYSHIYQPTIHISATHPPHSHAHSPCRSLRHPLAQHPHLTTAPTPAPNPPGPTRPTPSSRPSTPHPGTPSPSPARPSTAPRTRSHSSRRRQSRGRSP